MELKSIRIIAAAAAVCMALLLTASCGSSSDVKFRVLHASPGESDLDVVLDTKVVASKVTFGTASAYVTTPAGSHKFQLNTAGSSNALLNTTISPASATQVTVLVAGYPGQLAAISLLDNTTTPTSGDFTIRLINAAPSAGPVDAYIVAPSTDVTGVSPTLTSVAFETQSTYQSLVAGNFEVIFTQAGTKNVIATSGAAAYASGSIYSVVLLSQTFGGFTTAQLSN